MVWGRRARKAARKGVARTALGTAAIALALLPALEAPGTAAADGPPSLDRYELVNGCFALRSEHTGDWVVKGGLGYTATAIDPNSAEPFRMQATDLGRYLFYGPTPDFVARTPLLNTVAPAAQPSDDSDWTVNEDGNAFRIVNEFAGRDLAVGVGDALTTVPQGSGGAAGRFTVDAVSGCADYPEIEVNVTGDPETRAPDAPVKGFVETHMHQMAFEFLGGGAHCGRPWHRFGAPFALVDCPDHGDTNIPATEGCAALLEAAISGSVCHDTGGWPTFAGWPRHQQLTHEQSYYKWLERAWRGGLRIFVNLAVENRVLCELYPFGPGGTPAVNKSNCNEMDTVRRELQRMHELERYIDAQSGGPGEGWYRIVSSPEEARHVINDGKLAVVPGMEVSEPFGCRLMQPGDVPMCSAQQVDDGLDELYDLGVRQLELINKFDNGFSGVAGDGGSTGTITNGGNFLSAGTAWDLEHCDEPVNHDHSPTGLSHNDDELIANGLDALDALSGITLPVYGPPPHCNQRGLTPLGERVIQRIMSKGMIFDPDHMSVIGRNQALDLVESESYPGVMTSHSWSTDNALPRISALGGLIGPAAKSPEGFVEEWTHIKTHGYDQQNPYLFGFGWGADMNGFASQGGPPSTPITYPFQSSIDSGVTLDMQQSGTRAFDYNADGTAHYGLYPDWAEAVRLLGGQAIIDDMANGAEAYLQMWERATGSRGGGSPLTAPAPGGNAQKCAQLRAKLKKKGKSKKAKRKLRAKLRKLGCVSKKKKKGKKKKRGK